MSQYVTTIACDRPTPISMEDCENSGTELNKYELCFAMALQARRIQKHQNRAVVKNELDVRKMKSPTIESMKLAKEGCFA